jgi:tripartite-type tricarboxylate transporter receptor subunit TctC
MLIGLAVTTATRSPTFPNLPTMAEAGLPGFEATTWHGLVAPAGTPEAIIQKLNAATLTALRQPDLVKRLTSLGVDIAGGTPAEFAAYQQAEATKWGQVIKTAGIQIG